MANETITLTTRDKQSIAADIYRVEQPNTWFLLIHMMPATKESWQAFASQVQASGHASIAIDLRGHGQSSGGPNGYQKFNDADHQKSILDLAAAADYCAAHGAPPEKVILIGASIGANLALQFIAAHPEYKRAMLLSAGLNYRGVETEPAARRLRSDQTILLAAARDDDRSGGNAVEMSEKIFQAIPHNVAKELIVIEKGGHGTDLFASVDGPRLIEKIISLSDA